MTEDLCRKDGIDEPDTVYLDIGTYKWNATFQQDIDKGPDLLRLGRPECGPEGYLQVRKR